MTATRRSSATSSGSARSSAGGRRGRPTISPPTPRAGTRSARCMRPTAPSRRRCCKLVGKRPFQSMLDLGTGTGRLLEIFAPLYRRGVGIDMSREMLAVARANLDKAGVAQCAGAAGRHLRAAGRARRLRPGHHPSGAALSRRSGAGDPRGGARCCGRPAGWSSSISRRMRWNSCARSMRICGSAFPTGRSPSGSPKPGSTSRRAQDFEPRGGAEARLTVKLWLGRDRRLLIADPARKPAQGRPPDEPVPLFPPSRHRRQGPRLLRVLPAEDRRDGGAAVGHGDAAASR